MNSYVFLENVAIVDKCILLTAPTLGLVTMSQLQFPLSSVLMPCFFVILLIFGLSKTDLEFILQVI